MKHRYTLLAFIVLTIPCLVVPQETSAQPGALDPTFDPGTGANGIIHRTAIQSDGKIIIGGQFGTYNGTTRNRIARLNTDGSVDVTFDPGTGPNNIVYCTFPQSDGKIIIAGHFTTYNGTEQGGIARLNIDGTLDDAFIEPGTGASGWVYGTTQQNDGKIVIGGLFPMYNGTARNNIARLDADGTLDAVFDPGTGANSTVAAITLQSDGKIIIVGGFTSYNGTARNRIARINADGTVDATFNPGTGANSTIIAIALQGDGKIIIGGHFTAYNGTARNHIARLNTDGSLDTAFDPGTGANSYVQSIAVQNDGKIVIGGQFTTYNEMTRNNISRLNADGSVDDTFDSGTGTSSSVLDIAFQSNGGIVIVGIFDAYNGIPRKYIARVIGDDVNGLDIEGGRANDMAFRLYPNPNNGLFTIEGKGTDYIIEVHNGVGQLLFSERAHQQRTQLDLQQHPKGIYHVTLYANGQVSRFKVMKQ